MKSKHLETTPQIFGVQYNERKTVHESVVAMLAHNTEVRHTPKINSRSQLPYTMFKMLLFVLNVLLDTLTHADL